MEFFLLFKNLSGTWTHKTDRGYEAIMNIAKSLRFQKPVDISKKVDAKNYLIFKYVVENTRLKKIIPNLYRQTNFFFLR